MAGEIWLSSLRRLCLLWLRHRENRAAHYTRRRGWLPAGCRGRRLHARWPVRGSSSPRQPPPQFHGCQGI